MSNTSTYTVLGKQPHLPSKFWNKHTRQSSTKRTRTCGKRVLKIFTAPFRGIRWVWRKAFAPEHVTKVFVRRTSMISLPVLVHITSLAADLVLIVLNLQGSFIGYKFANTHQERTQTLELLALQVCAKIIELITVASMGIIIADFLHYVLLFDKNGLPVGLSGAKLSFGNILWIFTPTFWGGVLSFKRKRRRAVAATLIIICGLLATFIGPSSALLLTPAVHTDWFAGQAQFPQFGFGYALYPTRLDNDTVNLAGCSWSERSTWGFTLNDTIGHNVQHCPWFMTDTVAEVVQEVLDTQDFLRSMTVHDADTGAFLRRTIKFSNFVADFSGVWAITGLSRVNNMSSEIMALWLAAVSWASSLADITYFARWYFLRLNNGNTIQVDSLLPAVQTKCLVQQDVSFVNSTVLTFPAFALWDSSNGSLYTSGPPETWGPTKIVRAAWLETPKNASHDPYVSSGENYFPSAALSIQLPSNGSSTEGNAIACSVNAWWTNGTNTLTGLVADRWFGGVLDPAVNWEGPQSDATWEGPQNDGTWRFVELAAPWLNTLTLHSDLPDTGSNGSNATVGTDTISWFIMSDQGFLDYLDYFYKDDVDVARDYYGYAGPGWNIGKLELFISSMIVNAMARLNVLENTLDTSWQQSMQDQYAQASTSFAIYAQHWFPNATDAIFKPILGAWYSWPVPLPPGSADAELLTWSITISGYAYKADSIGAYLAITVIFVAMAMTVSHMVFLLLRRLSHIDKWGLPNRLRIPDWSSSVWGSPDQIVTLALHSPFRKLKKKRAGFRAAYGGGQSSLMLRSRAVDSTTSTEGPGSLDMDEADSDSEMYSEQVHLIDASHTSEYHQLKIDKLYS